jgi:hypothetical protein
MHDPETRLGGVKEAQTVTFEFKIQGEEVEKELCPRITFESWKKVEIVTRPAPLKTMESH